MAASAAPRPAKTTRTPLPAALADITGNNPQTGRPLAEGAPNAEYERPCNRVDSARVRAPILRFCTCVRQTDNLHRGMPGRLERGSDRAPCDVWSSKRLPVT